MAWIFWEHVFTDTPVELLTIFSIIALAGGAYRKIECHSSGCHRIGRFTHGHFHLCRVHHPEGPTSGKIGKEHIDAMTTRKKAEAGIIRIKRSEGSE